MPYLTGVPTPQDFGATGNGSTDDTAAVQAAITAAQTSGGTLLFPLGTYLLSSALTCTGTVNLEGLGPGVSVIHQSNTAANAITYNSAANLTGVSISGLSFTGPGSGSGIGIFLEANSGANSVSGPVISNVAVSGFGSHGISVVNSVSGVYGAIVGASLGGNVLSLTGGATASNTVLSVTGGTVSSTGTIFTSATVAAISTLLVGSGTTLGDNGVGEIQLANASSPPSTNPTGGAVVYARNGGLLTRDPNGGVFPLVAGPESAATTGAIAESIPRTQVSASSAFTSGNLLIQSIFLPAGESVGHIGFGTGGTAGSAMTHWWVALLDNSFVQRAHSADQTSGAIGASTWFNLAMVTPYAATYSGTYYLALMIAATTTMPTILQSGVTPVAQFWTGTSHPTPVPNGVSSSGLTAPGTDGTTTYIAPTTNAAPYYMYCAN